MSAKLKMNTALEKYLGFYQKNEKADFKKGCAKQARNDTIVEGVLLGILFLFLLNYHQEEGITYVAVPFLISWVIQSFIELIKACKYYLYSHKDIKGATSIYWQRIYTIKYTVISFIMAIAFIIYIIFTVKADYVVYMWLTISIIALLPITDLINLTILRGPAKKGQAIAEKEEAKHQEMIDRFDANARSAEEKY